MELKIYLKVMNDIFSKKDGIENIFESDEDNKNKESSIFD